VLERFGVDVQHDLMAITTVQGHSERLVRCRGY
jgi:hypothetical protein